MAKEFLFFNPWASAGVVFSVLAETDTSTILALPPFYVEWRRKIDRVKGAF